MARSFETFSWGATHSFFSGAWARHYVTIYRANLVLDKVPGIDFDETRKKQILTEATFLRASAYIILHDLFGPVPIITTSNTSASDRPSRPSKEEFDKFVTDDFKAAAEGLLTTTGRGRATKGAAYAQLAKYYLNVKDWANAADYAQKIIDLNVYHLFDGSADRSELFNPLNETNGPNAESIGLIKQVREKAGIEDLQLSNFGSKDLLLTAIFQERTWEFVAEEIHRQDQIRQGIFIQQAIDRGFDTKAYQVLYPILQTEIDKNSNLKQNDGY